MMKTRLRFKRRYLKKVLPDLLINNFRKAKGLLNFPYNQKVDFLIIGAQKCGTTALFEFLNEHPSIVGAKRKEVNFFNNNKNYNLGIHYYHSFFPKKKKRKYYFEASPSYLQDSDLIALDRIYKYNPEIKLIVLVRDPVIRAFSAYNMYRNRDPDWFDCWKRPGAFYIKRNEKNYDDFDFFIRNELEATENNMLIEAPVINHGKYVLGIEKYINKFGQDKVIVIDNDDLKNNTVIVLNDIIKFIDIKEHYNWKFKKGTTVFKGTYQNDIGKDAFALLTNIYRPYNEQLFKLLNKNFKWEY